MHPRRGRDDALMALPLMRDGCERLDGYDVSRVMRPLRGWTQCTKGVVLMPFLTFGILLVLLGFLLILLGPVAVSGTLALVLGLGLIIVGLIAVVVSLLGIAGSTRESASSRR